jgi:branched-chain amino acid transport system substrate-binding protein
MRLGQRLLAAFAVLVALAAITVLSAAPAAAEKRVALVIGIDNYKEVPRLEKAVNDGKAVGAVLRTLGFDVQEGYNLTQRDMARAIDAVRSRVGPGDAVFFFFAGHGVEIRGENFLLPADVPAAEEGQDGLVKDASFAAARVIERFQEKGARLVVAVLDACRNNPFERPGVRSLNVGRGLAPMDKAEGTFTLFSAGAKQLALDRLQPGDAETNSVFTRLFLPRLSQPGLSLVDLAKTTQQEVRDLAATVRHPQSPAYYDGVVGHVYLAGRSVAAAPMPRPDLCAAAEAHWRSAETIGTQPALEDHLTRFPSCAFAGLARAKIESLKRVAAAPPPPAATAVTPQPRIAPTPSRAGTLRIGVAGPMTGPNAAFGNQLGRGVEQAVDDINAAGGILGERIVLSLGDDASDPQQGVSVAKKFAADGVKFVIGHFNSGVTIPASEVYQDNGILQITPSSTNPRVTERGMWNVFRTCGRDDQQGIVAGEYIAKTLRGKRVAIVHDNTTYGQGLADETRKTMNARGVVEVLSERVSVGNKDFTSLVAKIRAARVDAVYWGGLAAEGGLIVRQMRAGGVGAVLISGDGITSDEFATIGGPGVEGTLMTFGPDPRKRPEARAVMQKFRSRNFEPEGYTLYSYAAMQVIKQAVEAAQSFDARRVAAQMSANMKFQTVIGDFGYNGKGDVTRLDYVIYTWKKGSDGKITYSENR